MVHNLTVREGGRPRPVAMGWVNVRLRMKSEEFHVEVPIMGLRSKFVSAHTVCLFCVLCE